MLPSSTVSVRPNCGDFVVNSGPPNHWLGAGDALVSRCLDCGIAYGRVDRVVVGQWSVERYACPKRLDWLVARMGKGSRRLEADSCSAIAERQVGRMIEP